MLFTILDTSTIDGGCNFSLKNGYSNPLGISNFRLREYAQYHQNYMIKKIAHERLVNDILTNRVLQESIDKSMKKTIAKNLIYRNQVFSDEVYNFMAPARPVIIFHDSNFRQNYRILEDVDKKKHAWKTINSRLRLCESELKVAYEKNLNHTKHTKRLESSRVVLWVEDIRLRKVYTDARKNG
jgi:predicted restriction endonuclease